MKYADWLEAGRGRTAALARHLGVAYSSIYNWKTQGVPVARMKTVRDFTHGAVSLEEMVPDPPQRESQAPPGALSPADATLTDN